MRSAMHNKYICPTCKKKFKNENGLRGHLQWMKDEEHQKIFREWGQTLEIGEGGKIKEVPPIGEKPLDEKKTLELPASEVPQALSEQQRKLPPIIPPPDRQLGEEVPLNKERPAVQPSALTAADIRQIIRDENQRIAPQQMEPIAKVERPTTPLDIEELEPYEWFKWFLNEKPRSYGLHPQTIEVLADRVQLRQGELPQPAQLQKDIPRIQKNITEEVAAVVAEAYFFHLQKYQESRRKKAEYWQQPYQGIRVPEVKPHIPYGDIHTQQSIPGQQHYQGQQQYPPQYYYQQPRPYERQGIPINPYQQSMQPYQTLEQELERLGRMQQLFTKTEEKSPAMEQFQRDNQELKQRLDTMAAEKQRELQDDLNQTRMQLQQEAQTRKQLEDTVRQYEFKATQGAPTETTVRLQEIQDKHKIEMKKLDEGGKTRDAIATAIQGGLTSVGQAISRTAMEAGSEKEVQLEGISDGRHTYQMPCPECNRTITAPITAKLITCPNCRKQYEVLPEEIQAPVQPQTAYQPPPTPRQPTSQAQPPQPAPQPQPVAQPRPVQPPQQQPPKQEAGFSVDIPPREAPPVELPPSEEEAPLMVEEADPVVEPEIKPPQQITQTVQIEKPEETPPPQQIIDKSREGQIMAEKEEQTKPDQPQEKLKSNINGHALKVEESSEKFACPDCEASFETEKQLKGHRLHHFKKAKNGKKE